ncbi:POGK-like protein [Mya arenaria]|uniref:POGK-like protein n=1 Tax=Mya arenaria TaxID=6604 RepID=A0ABY7DWM8_MYAAR|nr:POGK-like protein [Mya arenaria]
MLGRHAVNDGTKLKPAIVFKRKTLPKEKLPEGVIVYTQENGWVNERVLLEWLNDVLFKRPGALLNKKSRMVWDMFRAHLVDAVKAKLKGRRTYQAVIPGGCTSVLQPLDVCLNKPFKSNM